MTQQLEHWARIGRALERAGNVSHDRVRAALAAEVPFDELHTDERAMAMAAMEKRAFMPNGDPQLAQRLAKDHATLSTVNDKGEVVRIAPKRR